MKSCCLTETAARSPRPAPPSPTPPPSADGSRCSSSHTALPARSDTAHSTPHPCNTPAPAPPSRSEHCTTSHSHTNLSFAPGGCSLCQNLHSRTCSREQWPTDTPCPTTPSSRHTCPCRSEEHTSELQSPCNLVCRLLLE